MSDKDLADIKYITSCTIEENRHCNLQSPSGKPVRLSDARDFRMQMMEHGTATGLATP